jgi:hypothetical protein
MSSKSSLMFLSVNDKLVSSSLLQE